MNGTTQTRPDAKPGPVCYTLVEWEDDHGFSEEPSLDVNGDVIVLRATPDGGSAWDNAVGMARFILGADHDGPEREPREGMLPFVGILGHDHDDPGERYDDRTDDPQSWACGWVTLDGVVHEGDYENDEALWSRNFVANVIGENLIDYDLPVETGPRLTPVGDDGVHVLYGDRQTGITVVVRARDELDAERRILATFGDDATVESAEPSVDQTPLDVQAAAFAPYVYGDEPVPDDPAVVLAALDRRLAEGIAGHGRRARMMAHRERLVARIAEASKRVYLDVRYDVTDLTDDERGSLAGEAQAQADRSDGHPCVEVELDWNEVEA